MKFEQTSFFFLFLELLEIRMDRCDRVILRSVHSTVENGRHQVRVQRHRCCELRSICTDLLVYFFQLDYIHLVHGQRR